MGNETQSNKPSEEHHPSCWQGGSGITYNVICHRTSGPTHKAWLTGSRRVGRPIVTFRTDFRDGQYVGIHSKRKSRVGKAINAVEIIRIEHQRAAVRISWVESNDVGNAEICDTPWLCQDQVTRYQTGRIEQIVGKRGR